MLGCQCICIINFNVDLCLYNRFHMYLLLNSTIFEYKCEDVQVKVNVQSDVSKLPSDSAFESLGTIDFFANFSSCKSQMKRVYSLFFTNTFIGWDKNILFFSSDKWCFCKVHLLTINKGIFSKK